jgi:putative component of membrane protein insertase Oxa1/YidC/SpoIIIJ protein YidD
MGAMMTAVYPSSLAARAIEAYQQFISPYKGFRCAHRAVHGRDSCSQFAKRVALKRGILALFPLLRRRFTECSVAAQVMDYETREKQREDQKRAAASESSSSSSSSCDASPCAALECVPTGDCGGAEAVSAPADCASGADCGAVDCVSCDF